MSFSSSLNRKYCALANQSTASSLAGCKADASTETILAD